MKFLLNMNLPRSIGRQLKALGHSYRHVRDIGKSKASDLEIVIEAKSNKEVIITHDLDYGHLLTFSGEKEPSVIIFRLRNSHPDNLCKKLTNLWPEIEKPLLEGAIIIIEDAILPIRSLPVLNNDIK